MEGNANLIVPPKSRDWHLCEKSRSSVVVTMRAPLSYPLVSVGCTLLHDVPSRYRFLRQRNATVEGVIISSPIQLASRPSCQLPHHLGKSHIHSYIILVYDYRCSNLNSGGTAIRVSIPFRRRKGGKGNGACTLGCGPFRVSATPFLEHSECNIGLAQPLGEFPITLCLPTMLAILALLPLALASPIASRWASDTTSATFCNYHPGRNK